MKEQSKVLSQATDRGRDAGCSKTVTFDRNAAVHPGFEALR